ncbi:TPA: DUF3289 family protein [Enterobacter bugandensis]|uniref:DUF3289 family protein n=1 Tax=Enterobacter TaxID=547 RepID=UPI000F86F2C4|nr:MULTISPECIES: DUF3289 family protein [Enterobacter]EHN8829150.1 DUF3289 family protein [Enterobacter bugandensis]EHN8847704.1 DUF3289 family protein [Enterobacter bugandensis]MBE4807744.1 DUF3289 family protein [Enterobacter cloacae complex sp. P43RS]MCK6703707.1 DUF3289 family protein [Enterobacter bugandensis]MCK6779766.1 DUF3289 family protein [Enterobacter bugandensis]
MHISPPILLPYSPNGIFSDWVFQCMPVDTARNYPVNPVGAWHGGIHIPHTDISGAQANPIRAIADGTIIYARPSSENKDKKPLAYNGKTDDGCVLIRHKILIGDDPVEFVFYSLTMHMKQVRFEILSNIGQRIKREQVLGTSGVVDGKNAFHFQICCEQKMLDVLCGRIHGGINIAFPGRFKPVYGSEYYYFPAGTPVYGNIPKGFVHAPANITTEDLYIINSGGDTKTLRKKDDGFYDHLGSVAVGVNYISEASGVDFLKNAMGYSHWVKIALPGGSGWVDVCTDNIMTYSEAELPDWAGWSLIDDDASSDSQCNSKIIKKLYAEKKNDDAKDLLTHSICKFPFEWDFSTFEARFSWVKTKTDHLPEPLTDDDYNELKEHIKSLCFFDKLPAEVQKELSGQIWHFEPRVFITQIQKAERRLIFKTIKKMNDFTADDMRYGDMTKEQILAQGKMNKVDIFGREFKVNFFNFDKTIDEHFKSMDSMGYWTAWGEYSSLINIMLKKFKANEGGVLKHNLLNKAFSEHVTTVECVNKIKGFIKSLLDDNGYMSLSVNDLNVLNEKIRNGIKLPKFDSYDWFNGLGITIHDTYSTQIYLNYIDVSDGKFKAEISFQIQDHFGLDVADVNGKWFEDSPWFCSWFILQRYTEYGYMPFINEAEFTKVVEG